MSRTGIIHLCSFSVGCFKAQNPQGKHSIHFEDSDQFGPMKVDMRTGDLTEIPAKSWFWRYHRKWVEAGRPTTGSPMNTPCGPLQTADLKALA